MVTVVLPSTKNGKRDPICLASPQICNSTFGWGSTPAAAWTALIVILRFLCTDSTLQRRQVPPSSWITMAFPSRSAFWGAPALASGASAVASQNLSYDMT